MSDPRITYEGMNDDPGVDVSYADLPDNTTALFVDEFGHDTDAGTLTGSGEAGFPTSGLKPGRYYLSARASGSELCRTVDFYVAGAPDNL
jgi:hypothetical protein